MGNQSSQTSCMLMNLLGDSRYILFHATCSHVLLFFGTYGTTVFRLLWVSSLAYPNFLGTIKGLVVVVWYNCVYSNKDVFATEQHLCYSFP
jgi:hypothetical protein